MELTKQRPQKQLSQPAMGVSEHSESSSAGSRARGNQSSEGSDASAQPLTYITSPPHSVPASQGSDLTGRDSDSGNSLSSFLILMQAIHYLFLTLSVSIHLLQFLMFALKLFFSLPTSTFSLLLPHTLYPLPPPPHLLPVCFVLTSTSPLSHTCVL